MNGATGSVIMESQGWNIMRIFESSLIIRALPFHQVSWCTNCTDHRPPPLLLPFAEEQSVFAFFHSSQLDLSVNISSPLCSLNNDLRLSTHHPLLQLN